MRAKSAAAPEERCRRCRAPVCSKCCARFAALPLSLRVVFWDGRASDVRGSASCCSRSGSRLPSESKCVCTIIATSPGRPPARRSYLSVCTNMSGSPTCRTNTGMADAFDRSGLSVCQSLARSRLEWPCRAALDPAPPICAGAGTGVRRGFRLDRILSAEQVSGVLPGFIAGARRPSYVEDWAAVQFTLVSLASSFDRGLGAARIMKKTRDGV